MTAMHPDSGVPWTDAKNSIPSDIEQSLQNCNELWYSTSRCQPRFDPAAANAMLAELINLINKGEVTYDCSVLDQVQLSARYLIQRGLPRGGCMTGGPGTYALALDPPATRYNDFMTLTVIPNTDNNGAVYLNVDGLGTRPVLRNDGQPMKTGDLLANIPVQIMYKGVLCGGGTEGWYITGTVASQFGFPQQARFETPGNYTWYVPAGVHSILGEVYGGGGAGGTAMVTYNGGAGGGGSGYAREYIAVTPGSALSVTVAAGGLSGAAGTVTNGGSGGTSYFASTIMATGGGGGMAGSVEYPGTPSLSIPGMGYGGDINLQGAYGSSGASGTNLAGGYTGYGGLGGMSPGPEGGAGGGMSTGSSMPGVGFGAGGSGGGSAAGINSPGGNGHDGAVIITYFG